MKPKNYFNNGSQKNATSNTVGNFVSSVVEGVRNFVQKRPKKVLLAMLLLATLNFGLMAYMVNRSAPASLVVPIAAARSNGEKRQTATVSVEFSIANYMKVSKLKDSLDYLYKKEKSIERGFPALIRIYSEYSKLDPDFSKQLNKHIDKNLKSNNHESRTPH